LFLLVAGKYPAVKDIEIPHRLLGYISDERLLSIVYSAADLCVVPSLQDTGPMIPMESMACGTPVIGFPAGMMPEIVRDGVTGLVVPMGNAEALREGIRRMLLSPEALVGMRDQCRRAAVEQYSISRLAREHMSLYDELSANLRGGVN
jgi:glycosyltransferase involved in cell wall biosynthesis